MFFVQRRFAALTVQVQTLFGVCSIASVATVGIAVVVALGFADRAVSTANTLNNLNTNFFDTGFRLNDPKTLQSDYYVQDASFFRLDNITLGYNLPARVLKGVDVRIYGSANNVVLVSEYDGIDPEIPGGIDNNFYPRPQIYSLGLNINF